MTCTSTESESLDELIRLLTDSCRRTLLHVLVTGPHDQSVDDVVDQVVAESEARGARPTDRGRIRSELHHKHLPTLDDRGVVDYDPANNAVTYLPDEDLESLLEFVDTLITDGE